MPLSRYLKATGKLLAGMLVAMGAASCVHQFPEPIENGIVMLEVKHDLQWLPDYEMTISRADEAGYVIRYDFRIYPHGNTTNLVKAVTIYKDNLMRPDFTTEINLVPGEYDIYAWSDYAYASTEDAVYYDDADFADITYIKPYEGDTDLRDAFRGVTTVTVDDPGLMEPTPVSGVITLARPLARYKFIATDLAAFIDRETTRGRLTPSEDDVLLGDGNPRWAKLSDYKVKVIYPMYMPAVFNNFKNNPVDSWTGVTFDCKMLQLSGDDAQLAMDYVYVNGEESSVQVMLEVYDPDGLLLARTTSITVPTKRNRTTIIYGKFLTTLRSDGVGIDPDFEGEYNIQLP